jgi:hypothetical protein
VECHVVADQHAAADAHGEPHALVIGVADADGEPDAGDAVFEVQDAEHPHSIAGNSVFVAHDFDVAEAEGFKQRFHNLVVGERPMG